MSALLTTEKLNHSASMTLAEQLSSRFAERINSRLLAPGSRLPSVRQCAQQQQVSPSTVVAAYDQLLALGLVEARKNRGFFVREAALNISANGSVNKPLAGVFNTYIAINNIANLQATHATRECRHADSRHVCARQRKTAAGHGHVST